MKKYEFLEGATADFLFRAYGSTLSEAFENAALAFFEVMTDTSKVKPIKRFKLSKKSEDLKALLYDFLEELLYLHEVNHIFFSKFKVSVDEKTNSLTAIVWGEPIDFNVHEARSDVKAMTYSNMKIEKTSTGYMIQGVPDV